MATVNELGQLMARQLEKVKQETRDAMGAWLARDIFRDGPSPGLQAKWDAIEAKVAEWRSPSTTAERKAELWTDRDVYDRVACYECGQPLPSKED